MSLKTTLTAGALAATLMACAGGAMEQKEAMAPFGGADSVGYAADLWVALTKANLAGAGAIQSRPYKGLHPHGTVLDTIEGAVTVGGHTGEVIVKRNYAGDDASIETVSDDPGKYLDAVTVMFKREAGYDSENKDWFWAKYKPDGSLDKNPAGMQLAGRVAKGKPAGCIACHKAAPGGDMVFIHN